MGWEDQDDEDDDDSDSGFLFGEDDEDEVTEGDEGEDSFSDDDDIYDEDEDYEEEEEGEDAPPDPEDRCKMCGIQGSDVDNEDKWDFQLVEEDGTGARDIWICGTCHGMFSRREDFDRFWSDASSRKLFGAAERLQRMVILGAPPAIIANLILSGIAGVLFSDDENHGSEEMRAAAKEELARAAEKFLGNRKD